MRAQIKRHFFGIHKRVIYFKSRKKIRREREMRRRNLRLDCGDETRLLPVRGSESGDNRTCARDIDSRYII